MFYFKNSVGDVFAFDRMPENEQGASQLIQLSEEEATILLSKPVPVTVPGFLTKKQAKQALILVGMFSNVKAAIESIPDETQRLMVQVAWDDSATFERSDSTLLMLASALGLTDEELDQLFIMGAQL